MSGHRALAALAAVALAAPAVAQEAPAPAPAADPARVAAAEPVVKALVPDGVYMRMMRDQLPKMMDMMMAQAGTMKPSDLGLPDGNGETIGAAAAKADPAFQERMRIMMRVMGEEMGGIFTRVEPKLRTGLSKSFARRFTLAQLNEMNAFFSSPTGKVFAQDYLLTFMDPEVLSEMMSVTPELMKAMPGIMKKVEEQTQHLPPPPKPKTSSQEGEDE